MHARRQFLPASAAENALHKAKGDELKGPALAEWENTRDVRPRLLVLGSGWGAHALVKVSARSFLVSCLFSLFLVGYIL
jgi:hypothetical protein